VAVSLSVFQLTSIYCVIELHFDEGRKSFQADNLKLNILKFIFHFLVVDFSDKIHAIQGNIAEMFAQQEKPAKLLPLLKLYSFKNSVLNMQEYLNYLKGREGDYCAV